MLSIIFLILSPWILLFVVVFLSGGSVNNSYPLWSDELVYWHEILSFSEKGLNSGYYTIHEITPRLLSFGTHGFGTVISYTPYAKIIGWNYNSIVIANNLFVSIAFLLLILLVKPSTKKIILLTILYLSYIPVILFCSTSMSELLNYSLVIIYFTLLYCYSKTERSSKILFIILMIFCTYISFVRIIYIALFLPVLMHNFKINKLNSKFVKVLTIWSLWSICIYAINSLFVSPYPFSFLFKLFSSPSVSEFLNTFITHAVNNLTRLFLPYDSNLQFVLRYFVIILLIAFLWKSNLIQSKFKTFNFCYFTVFILLLFFVLINILAYDIFDWRDSRVFAPMLFGTILFVTLVDEKMQIIKYSIFFNLINLPLLFYYLDQEPHLDSSRYSKIEINPDLIGLTYNPNAKSAFENTIIINKAESNIILNIPAGIGCTYYSDQIPDKVKSKYIYTEQTLSLVNYKIVRSSDNGILYERIEY